MYRFSFPLQESTVGKQHRKPEKRAVTEYLNEKPRKLKQINLEGEKKMKRKFTDKQKSA